MEVPADKIYNIIPIKISPWFQGLIYFIGFFSWER